jgi:hypothetical protein
MSEYLFASRLKQPSVQLHLLAYISGEGLTENSSQAVHDFGSSSIWVLLAESLPEKKNTVSQYQLFRIISLIF